MTWLKHKGKLINLAHITAIQVEGKEIEGIEEERKAYLAGMGKSKGGHRK